MITHTTRLPYEYGDVIQLKPIADVHLGSNHCDEKGFKSFLAEDPDAWIIGNGDLLDCVITSDIKRYRKSADASEGDDIVDQQIHRMYELLKPYKERILGLGTGNHEDVITKKCGTNPIKRLCSLLDVPFLGYSWLLELRLRREGGGGRRVVIRGHHGWGGGSRTQGADLTKYSKDTAYWDADIFLYGHVHRLQTDRIPRMGLVGEKLAAKPKIMLLTGTFLKTYSNGSDVSYSEAKGYPPVEIGGAILNIKPNSNYMDMWVDL